MRIGTTTNSDFHLDATDVDDFVGLTGNFGGGGDTIACTAGSSNDDNTAAGGGGVAQAPGDSRATIITAVAGVITAVAGLIVALTPILQRRPDTGASRSG